MSTERPTAPPVRSPERALLFDGDCGLCTWSAAQARRIDRQERFAILPFQELSAGDLARYGLTAADCARRAYVVAPWPPGRAAGAPRGGGSSPERPRATGGAFAANAFFLRIFPWNVAVVILYALPPLLLVEVLAYRWIASHRAAISRRFGLEACRRRF